MRRQLGSKGFTMVEVLVSVGIMGIIALVISTLSTSTFSLFSDMEKTQALSVALEDIKHAVQTNPQCTENLKNTPLALANTVGAKITKLSNYNLEKENTGDVVQVGKKFRGVNVAEMRVVPVAQIDTGLMVANIEVDFERSGAKDANGKQSRIVPIFAKVSGGKISECWQRFEEGSLEASQVCAATSGGALNSATGASADCGLANGKWFTVDDRTARCPEGTTLPKAATAKSNCRCSAAAGFSDDFTKATVKLTDGSVSKFTRSATIRRMNAETSTCKCATATDLPPEQVAKIQTSILCMTR